MGLSLGDMLIILADWISRIARLLINITVGAVVIFLALRWLNDVLGANPFGRLSYYLRKPTNDLVYYVRSSQFYIPLKQALKFDPTYLLVLIAVAIVWYVALSVIGYLNTVLGGLGTSLKFLAAGDVARGVYTLIGTSLLAVIFFLMTLMTIVFINWISGRFNRAAYWSMHRISPLLRVFEFGGALAGFSFLILWLVLSLAASAVVAVFFGS
ncbi:MAG TPA: hypothetical protein VHR27_04120 [Blastocatellia bacterium]|jgi:hypothetical protein|nr:hypothetical protein [Blastocatellia bacterium]